MHAGKNKQKMLLFLFWWLRCCCSSLIDGDVLKKIRLVSAFCLIRVRNQSHSVWLGTYCCSFSQPQVPAYISTEAEIGAGYCFFLLRFSVLYTAMLRTSIAAVVLGCFYFCPLDCDASVTVVDCPAVETGCMLEKFIKVATKYVFIFIFWSRCCCCCCCCVLLLPSTTSVLKRRELPATVSSFSVSATTTTVSFASIILLLLLLRRDMGFYFLVEVLQLLIIFLVGCAAAAAGACAAYNIRTEAGRGTGYCFFLLRFCR